MKKQGIKLTSKVLTGLVLLTGITSLPTNAVEVKTAAVDVNKASVKAKVYELNGHYYAKLVADKEVANVIARITTETKSEFVLKKDLIKAGEEVVVELDMTAKAPTRKLPNTEVKREGYTAVNKVGTHTFNINVRYEIATDEVKAKQEENKKVVNPPATETKKDETPTASSTNNEDKGNEAATKSEQPAATTPAENTKSVEAQKTAETTVARPNTSDNEKPADKPADLSKQSTKPVAGTDRSAVATPAKEDTKAVERKAQAVKEEKAATATKTEAEKPKQQTPAAPAAGSREEQIRKAFLDKVAKLRNINGLPALSENAALNSSSKFRSSDVPTRAVDANIHGPNGTIQYEKDAAKAAGYANYILANISITGDTGTPEEVAQRLFDILFKEIGNVVAKYPYGHRNTLLDATAKDVGAGVTIKNGQVYLVQHQSSNEAFNGTTPKAGKYLDGSNTIFKGGKPV
ncbi:MAG: CAP domain-containing protein [Gemella haemolysans]|uniref:CAP domain-containing protein n=1 Tax=Gemella haemolysans TaxID=1379 RepID=UPI0029062723|nr:CAP domain-containing protein [Gemella haemolysans]MDU4713553.1 CAP domain-containing protein [Gemella haemolysans]